MDKGLIVTVAIAAVVGGVGLIWFLVSKAPNLPSDLERRAQDAGTVLAIAAAQMLRDIRDDLNVVLRPFDAGDDPYLSRMDYRVPAPLLRQHRRLARLGRAAATASVRIHRRISFAQRIAYVFTGAMVLALVSACLTDYIGLVPAQILVSAGGLFFVLALAYGLFFIRPYNDVNRAQTAAREQMRARPAVRVAARALEVPDADEEDQVQW